MRASFRPILGLVTGLLACRPAAEPPPAPPPPPPPPPPPSSSAPAPASVMGTVIALNATWGDHYGRGDIEGLLPFYTPDAVLMTPGGDIAGLEAIRAHLRREIGARRDSILATNTTTETLELAGDRAYEAGTVRYTLGSRTDPSGPPRELRVRYVTFWQAMPDGRWRIRRSLRSP